MDSDHFSGDSLTNRERVLAGDLYVADEHHRADVAGAPGARRILAELLCSLGEDSAIGAGSVVVGDPARVVRTVG